jgi:dTDP-4-amino-4,6-dideoxygalactose transaminase
MDRDSLISLLANQGIEARMQFPPQHLSFPGKARGLSNTTFLASRLISLPTGAGMTSQALSAVVRALEEGGRASGSIR